MYTEEYNRNGFPVKDFLTKLVLVIVFVLLLVLLLPKFIQPKIVQQNCNDSKLSSTSESCDSVAYNSLTSQIFQDNIDRIKEAAISYYTTDRLPETVGAKDTMTLGEMIEKKLLTTLYDKNNKKVDQEKSYVEITKMEDEYLLKVYIKDSAEEDYVLVHLGCYNYCESTLCEKNNDAEYEQGFTKSAKSSYVEITPSYTVTTTSSSNGTKKTTKNYNTTKKYYNNTTNNYYNNTTNNYYNETIDITNIMDNDTIIIINNDCDECEEDNTCRYDTKTKTYYGKDGNEVTKDEFIAQCTEPEPEPQPEPQPEPKVCKYDKDTNTYYGEDGNKVSRDEFIAQCTEPEQKVCVYDKDNNKYYGENGTEVTKDEFIAQCTEPEPEQKICVYDKDNNKYYGENGTEVTKDEFISQCTEPEPQPEPKICQYDKATNTYYGKDGSVVTSQEFISQCTEPEPEIEYIYEYKKTTGAEMSKWSTWSDWSKTNCNTQEKYCDDNDTNCLKETQILKRKEQIGTYNKTFAKERVEQRQVATYTQKACSKYNYIIVDNTTYALTTTTHYTKINTVKTTKTTAVKKAGGWTYQGRSLYSNPPRDSATTHYKFVGADYSYCTNTCTTLPNFYYDSYKYTAGDLQTTTSTTTTPSIRTSTTTSETSHTDTSVTASCGSYVYKQIPIYRSITVTDKSTINKPLYGNVCYASNKTRKVVKEGSTSYKWSSYNDQSLLNDGWVLTGKKQVKA